LKPIVDPQGRPLPMGYRWIFAHGIRSLTPWHFLTEQDRALVLRDEFLVETSDARDWIPFAHMQTGDDWAGFALDANAAATGEVWEVHLTFARRAELPGFPSVEKYRDFWDWFERSAIPETRDWAARASDDDVADLARD
jgi:hypothetical protein